MVRVEFRDGSAKASALPTASRPSLPRRSGEDGLVSLRELKGLVERLEPTDPVRIMVLGEPDHVPRAEYAAKILSWYRLILTSGDSGRPGVR